MECAQINVSGGSGTTKPSTVSLPGAYSVNHRSPITVEMPSTDPFKATDPGILINIYPNPATYTIPGPAPFTCGAGGTDAPSQVVAPESPPLTQTTLVTVAKATPASTKGASSSTNNGKQAALYGRCGGTGWTGATTCASGTCKASSSSYSKFSQY
jgi:cellulase